MHFENVCLEALGYTLPEEVLRSDEIERRLDPLYRRLSLPEGRLELMSGIRERRFWPPGTLPSEPSARSAERVILDSGIDCGEIGALVHGSVCRDHLEPATACAVHHKLGLRPDCMIYDVSNACLGLLNGIIQVATMIDMGYIRAGIVVGSEGGRELVETTIDRLNQDETLTRETIKPAFASLTIGSGSCAILLVNRELSATDNSLFAASCRANTDHHQLCHSGQDESVAEGMQPWMTTDSVQLMREGITTGVETFSNFLHHAGWSANDVDKTFCHQVGAIHRKLMLEALGIVPSADYSTLEWLGNTGSVALPITMAIGSENGHLEPGDNVALLGIGSGINCVMLAVNWQQNTASASENSNTTSDADRSHKLKD